MQERPHHPTLSPSSIGAILQCACYTSNKEKTEDSTLGNEIHDYTAALVLGKEPPKCENLDDSDIGHCEWAAELIKTWCGSHFPGEPIVNEPRLAVINPLTKSELTYGYADYVCGAGIIDLKSSLDYNPEAHNYKPQLQTYALARMQELGVREIWCMEVYVCPEKFNDYTTTWNEASAVVECAIQRRDDAIKVYTPCDFCGLCANLKTCPRVNEMFQSVAIRYGSIDTNMEKILVADQLQDPLVMSQAMLFVKKILEPFGKKMMEAGKEMIKAHPEQFPNWKLTEQNGRKSVNDPKRAFHTLHHKYPQLTEDEFMSCLSVSLDKTASKLKALTGTPKTAAERDIESTLRENGLISQAESFSKLTMSKEIEQK